MDLVFIRGFRVSTIIGVYDWERQVKQNLIFNVDMANDVRKAAAEDDIEHALDYSAVTKRIEQFVTEGKFNLLETVAERLAEALMAEFRIPWLRLEVEKPFPLAGGHSAGVAVERGVRS